MSEPKPVTVAGLRELAAATPNAITALELRVQAIELEVAAMNDVHEAAQTLRSVPRKRAANARTPEARAAAKRARKAK